MLQKILSNFVLPLKSCFVRLILKRKSLQINWLSDFVNTIGYNITIFFFLSRQAISLDLIFIFLLANSKYPVWMGNAIIIFVRFKFKFICNHCVYWLCW